VSGNPSSPDEATNRDLPSEVANVSDRAPRSYPKHVWSPAGGWYANPSNWRGNTLAAGAVIVSILAVTWKFSAGREEFVRNPTPEEFSPSRYWNKQFLAAEKARKASEQ
jgi:hypothetical protein